MMRADLPPVRRSVVLWACGRERVKAESRILNCASPVEGNPFLRWLFVQSAQYILGPFGKDCELRRWGLKLAGRERKNAKKRAVAAVARKLAVLLHRLCVNGEVYHPFYGSHQHQPMALIS